MGTGRDRRSQMTAVTAPSLVGGESTGRATLGEVPTSRTAGVVAVSLVRHQPGMVLMPHHHVTASITVVLGGDYLEEFAGVAHTLAPMSAATKPPGTVHANRIGRRGARSLLLEIAEHDLWRIGAAATLFAAPRVVGDGPSAAVALHLALELRRAGATPDEATPLALESLTMEWFAVVGRERVTESGRVPRWLSDVRNRVHSTPVESLRLECLARDAGRHSSYVARLFRHHYGMSVGEYARQLRVARAARALAREPGAPISRVALEAGYYDHSHLTRDFRARTQASPSEWRRAAAAGG